jgi:(p)ppGpp synthase/HD superfamily hydrolase
MIYTDLTKKALKVCFEAHKEQVDKSGMPYVFHPFHLAEQMTDEYTTVCALLHDVIEDTDYTWQDLQKMGFPHEILEALRLLTHEESVPYMEYVQKITKNPIAIKVKIADLRHNSDLSRLDTIDEPAIARTQKYQKALDFLLTFENK